MYVLFFYQTKTQQVPSDGYPLHDYQMGGLGWIIDNWLKMHSDGFVRVEVANGQR
jgi:hypothetical protein